MARDAPHPRAGRSLGGLGHDAHMSMSDDREPNEVFLALRGKVLGLDPAEVAITASPRLPRVWAVLMETGYPGAVATLAALADGTTSLYLSSGGGMIGAGGHTRVAEATL